MSSELFVVQQSPKKLLTQLCALQGFKLTQQDIDGNSDKFKEFIDKVNSKIQDVGVSSNPSEYSCFLSYRVSTDANQVRRVYESLADRNIRSFLDEQCLQPAIPWKDQFISALVSSRIYIPFLSNAAFKHYKEKTSDGRNDSLLLEIETALELSKKQSLLIYPVFLSNPNDFSFDFSSYSDFDASTKFIVIESIDQPPMEFQSIYKNPGNCFYYLLPHNTAYQIKIKNPFYSVAGGRKCGMKVYVDGFDRHHPEKFCVGYWTVRSEYATITRPLTESERFRFARVKLVQEAEDVGKVSDPLALTELQKEIARITPLGTDIVGGREGNGLITVVFHPELVEEEESEEEDQSDDTEEEDEDDEGTEADQLVDLSRPAEYRKDRVAPLVSPPQHSLPVPPTQSANLLPSMPLPPRPVRPTSTQRNPPKLASGATYLMGKSSQKFGRQDRSFKPDTSREIVCYVRLVADAEEDLAKCPSIQQHDANRAARPISDGYHLQAQRPAPVEDI
jgi:hypothetical protein